MDNGRLAGRLFHLAAVGGGGATLVIGLGFLADGDTLGGAATIGAGVVFVLSGFLGALRAQPVLTDLAILGMSVILVVFGVDGLRSGDTAFGVAVLALGVAGSMAGVRWMRESAGPARIDRWWWRLTADRRVVADDGPGHPETEP